MFTFWCLLLSSYFFLFSLAKPLVAPQLGELAGREIHSHSIPAPPPFLFPSPRAPAAEVSMSSFAIFPLLAYSTLLAVFGFISVRIARWRKRRPAALELEDDGVELLPTNTSTLSPEFKDMPVPPPLPSPIPSHTRSRSFTNLQLVHAIPERERPKSPLQFGISSPGSRLKSKQRSHSVGAVSSPLSPTRRQPKSARRLVMSDPESDTETPHTFVSTPNTPFPPQAKFGTLVDLSVPPVPVSSPMNPTYQGMKSSAQVWTFDSPMYSHSHSSDVNLIDLHAPETGKDVNMGVNTKTEVKPEPISVPIPAETEADSESGYEQDLESGNSLNLGNGTEKEVDIGWEWGFDSVPSLSTRVFPRAQEEGESEEDLVDGSADSPLDPTAPAQLHPIPITASSSGSEAHLDLFELTVLDTGTSVIEAPASEDKLPPIYPDDTSLASDMISKVYISDADVPEVGLVVGPEARMEEGPDEEVYDNNDINDIYDRNDGNDGKEEEDSAASGEESPVVEVQAEGGVHPPAPESDIQAQDLVLTPPPSYELLADLLSPDIPVVDAACSSTVEVTKPKDSVEHQADGGEDILVHNGEEQEEERFPDPDLLPLPEVEIPVPAAPDTSIKEFPTPVQIPTPPASPPLQRRPLPRPLPAWSIRAADAPALGLPSSTMHLRNKPSWQDMRSGATDAMSGDDTNEPHEEMKISSPQTDEKAVDEHPKTFTSTLPGTFLVDVHPLSDRVEQLQEKTTVESLSKETGSPSSSDPQPATGTSGDADTDAGASSLPSASPPTSTAVIKPPRRRSPIDIALAMQLRPGLGLGADPAWMVRFLMAMFGWFVVLISGSAADGYGGTPYVGIRRSR